MPLMSIDDAVVRVRMEFAEVPGLKLTWWQIQHLLRLSRDECAGALKILMESDYLARTVEGAYVRGRLPEVRALYDHESAQDSRT